MNNQDPLFFRVDYSSFFSFVIEGEGDAQRNPSEQTGEAQGEAAKQES